MIIFGSALLLGLVVVPLLIWVVGNRILGPYTHGNNLHAGPMALLGDFYEGLSKGWLSYWIVAVGPLVIIVKGTLQAGGFWHVLRVNERTGRLWQAFQMDPSPLQVFLGGNILRQKPIISSTTTSGLRSWAG